MQKTANYGLNKPEPQDYVIIGDLNYNTDEIDKLIKSINDALAILNTDGVSLLDLLNKKADLDSDKKIKIEQLPDLDVYKDVLMFETKGNFPPKGDNKKLYIDKKTEKIYRWSVTEYSEISKSLSIGETKGTAFDGKRGKDLEDAMKNRYTKAEVDSLIVELKKKLEVDIIEQILAFS